MDYNEFRIFLRSPGEHHATALTQYLSQLIHKSFVSIDRRDIVSFIMNDEPILCALKLQGNQRLFADVGSLL